jgi:hypothetical protein
MLRYCQLGRLLPQRDEVSSIADLDLSGQAGIELVLNEMSRVKAEIDAFLDAARDAEPAA